MLLGVLCGVVGAVFLKLLRLGEEQFRKLNWPVYLRLTLAGFIVGIIAIGFPGVCGNGYSVTNDILHEKFLTAANPLLWLAGLLVAKWVATAATVGAGTVGGVFTPTLFVGAGRRRAVRHGAASVGRFGGGGAGGRVCAGGHGRGAGGDDAVAVAGDDHDF